MTYAVIMAGGIGSRFWPRSREAQPKQFLNVFGDATLIQSTVARLQGLIPPERCLIVTNEQYVEEIAEQLPAVPRDNILAEPLGRNTAPCIAYAASHLQHRDPEATMVVLPADHVIRNATEFHRVLKAAIKKAQEPDALVTIGIMPTHPETGYGYIQFEREGDEDVSPVRTFAEKPDLATAERFLDSGDFLWNSGMFIWRVDSILDNLEKHLPKVHEAFLPLQGRDASPRRPLASESTNGQAHDVVAEAYQRSPSISIDYGVMERAEKVYVVPGAFGWSDVGDWRAAYELSEKDEHGNALKGHALVHDSSRCLVQSNGRLIVLVGMHDTVVVDTEDALLVCHRESAQQVKNVVDYLHVHQLEEYV